MLTMEKIAREIGAVQQRIEDDELLIKGYKELMVKEHSPLKPGDDTTAGSHINVFDAPSGWNYIPSSYFGKKCKVYAAKYTPFGGNKKAAFFTIYAKLYKQNGELGERYVDWNIWCPEYTPNV